MSHEVTQHAVIDRIHGVHVVLLVGPDEVETIVSRASLPADAVEGTWLHVRFEGDRLVMASLDTSASKEADERIISKMELLRRRGSRLSGADDTE